MVNRPALVELASGAAHGIRDRFVAAMADGHLSPEEEWEVLHAISLTCRLSDEAVIAQTTGLAAIRCGLDSPRVDRLVADAQSFESTGDVARLPTSPLELSTTDALLAAVTELSQIVAAVASSMTTAPVAHDAALRLAGG